MKPCYHILLPPLLYALMVQFSMEWVILKEHIVPFEDLTTNDAKVQKVITNYHNLVRRRVKPPASNMLKMNWSPQLAISAKKWADLCYLNHSTVSYRTIDGSPCGENILISPACLSWEDVIRIWESEKEFLNFSIGAIKDMIVAHYTQLVADNTFSVGCAVAECPGDPNFCFYVCHYYTAGNAAASLYTPYIQGKPCRKCKAACDGQKLCLNYCPHADRAINCLKAKYYNLCPHPRVKLLCRATCECVNQIF